MRQYTVDYPSNSLASCCKAWHCVLRLRSYWLGSHDTDSRKRWTSWRKTPTTRWNDETTGLHASYESPASSTRHRLHLPLKHSSI